MADAVMRIGHEAIIGSEFWGKGMPTRICPTLESIKHHDGFKDLAIRIFNAVDVGDVVQSRHLITDLYDYFGRRQMVGFMLQSVAVRYEDPEDVLMWMIYEVFDPDMIPLAIQIAKDLELF